MNIKIKIILLIGGILCAILLICNRPGIYCKNYYAVVNFANNNSYEAIINDNGPIKETKIIDDFEYDFEYVFYDDGRTFVFRVFPSGSKEFCRIDITSEQYRFGKKQIGVGTTREQIESIYKSGKNKYYAEENRINVVESKTSISFLFNNQDIVYEIHVGPPDVYE